MRWWVRALGRGPAPGRGITGSVWTTASRWASVLEACDACSASLPAMSLHEVLRLSAKVHVGDPVLIVDMTPACTLTAGCDVRSLRVLCCMGCECNASAREKRVLRAGDRGLPCAGLLEKWREAGQRWLEIACPRIISEIRSCAGAVKEWAEKGRSWQEAGSRGGCAREGLQGAAGCGGRPCRFASLHCADASAALIVCHRTDSEQH